VGVAVGILLGLLVVAINAGARPTRHRPCTDTSVRCLDAVAYSYIDALASNDPATADKVRAAPNVQKWENGVHNATNRSELIAAIKATQLLVTGIREVRLFPGQDGHDLFAMYLADGGATPSVSVTSHVIERLEIHHGLITQIEIADCMGGPGEVSQPAPEAPAASVDFALCTRGPRLFPLARS
jgi:hypothetical protein